MLIREGTNIAGSFLFACGWQGMSAGFHVQPDAPAAITGTFNIDVASRMGCKALYASTLFAQLLPLDV